MVGAILAALLASCNSAPVQEMSDARQAIRAAEEAGARQHAPVRLSTAEALLHKAESSLSGGAYFDARRYALEALETAIDARESAAAIGQ